MARLRDLSGLKFNRLTVKDRAPNRGRLVMWNVTCDCGNTRVVQGAKIVGIDPPVKSCGCLSAERTRLRKPAESHKMYGTRTYQVWANMKSRCTNPKNRSYKRYGGRGIKVCERWERFENFYEDMGDPPPGLTLERDNNDGNYELGNCRWATRTEQNNNRSHPSTWDRRL